MSLHTNPLAAPGEGDAGGMNVHVRSLASGLAARGHSVELVTRRTDTREPRENELADGVTVRIVDAGPPSLAKSDLPQILPAFARELERLGTFDVLHAHYWLSGAAALRSRQRAAVVASFHTLGAMKNRMLADHDVPEPTARLDAEADLARRAHGVIVSSAAEAREVGSLGADARRIHTIAPGVDADFFAPRRAIEAPAWLKEAAAGRPVVCVLGRVQPLKGQDVAIEAVARIPAAARPLLVIAGGTSPGHDDFVERIGARAEHLGVDARFVGALSRDEAASVLAASALVLIPSLSETFGLVALEAAASGTPVIAARTTGLNDSVADGVSGELVADRDPVAWARRIVDVLADSSRLAALRASARDFALGHTWARVALSTELAYLDALEVRG